MLVKKLMRGLLIALACMTVSLPGHAAMVGTAQMQSDSMVFEAGDVANQRDWILEQLIVGGVKKSDAQIRVAAMTDAQVQEIHKRIDENPAGGNVIIIVFLVLVISDLLGYTDIFPFIRPAE
jgi:hypothetical protein